MARIVSGRPLKSAKPHWFCHAEGAGDVRSLAASGVHLNYVIEPREIASVWRYLGNPKFRGDYDYLLVGTPDPITQTMDVYAVKLPRHVGETKRKRNPFYGHFDAFAGMVDKICYGWATHSAIKAMQEPEISPARDDINPF